jgi:hypothetical protein
LFPIRHSVVSDVGYFLRRLNLRDVGSETSVNDIYIRLKIKPNSVRIRSLSFQIFVPPSTGFEHAPLIHCSTNRLALCPVPLTTRPHPLCILLIVAIIFHIKLFYLKGRGKAAKRRLLHKHKKYATTIQFMSIKHIFLE